MSIFYVLFQGMRSPTPLGKPAVVAAINIGCDLNAKKQCCALFTPLDASK